MLIEAALATAIQHSNPAVTEPRASQYASWVAEAALKNHTDPWIFIAIINRETGWNPELVRRESNGTCSVGLGQINSLGPCTTDHIATYTDPHANIERMGKLFYIFHETCREDCGDMHWLRRYNPGSPAYLAAIIQAVKNYHAQTGEPVVLPVPAPVHVAGVSRPSGGGTSHVSRVDPRHDHPTRHDKSGRR